MPINETPPEFELLCSPWISLKQRSLWENHLSHAQCHLYKKNDIIIQPGQHLQHLYYLKKGKVKTVAQNSLGQQKTIWYIESGCVFGETPLFNQKPCAYFFHAVNKSEVYKFSKDILLQKLLPQYPDLAVCLLHSLARKVHILSSQVEDSAFYKPIIRVSKLIYLLYQDKSKTGRKSDSSLPVTQEDIADILGIHRVTVNNAIRQLKNEGILATSTHMIIVNNFDKLKELVSLYS